MLGDGGGEVGPPLREAVSISEDGIVRLEDTWLRSRCLKTPGSDLTYPNGNHSLLEASSPCSSARCLASGDCCVLEEGSSVAEAIVEYGSAYAADRR